MPGGGFNLSRPGYIASENFAGATAPDTIDSVSLDPSMSMSRMPTLHPRTTSATACALPMPP